MPSSRQEGLAFKSRVLARPAQQSDGLVASARNMGKIPNQRVRSAMKPEGWQDVAWNYFDTIGEYRYSVAWVGNLLSKARLTVLYDGKPTDNPAALEGLNHLFGGPDGQAEMFRQIGYHLTVAGECHIIGDVDDESGGDEWMVGASSKVSETASGTWTLGALRLRDPLVIRLWKPHPVDPLKSDCPTRAVLPILAEIDGLTKHVAAQIDSRLASAGLLILPSEISFGSSPTSQTEGEGAEEVTKQDQEGADAFVAELVRVAKMAIADRGDASALVPIVLQVAGEYVDKVQHLTFWSQLDKQAINLRKEAIRRLALGMDMPPEVLEGTADMNHWSSWQVEEAAIKSHTEPLLAIVTSSLTTGYLRPLLLDSMPEAEANRYSFGYDDAKMRLRPNRSKEALELYDRGALSLEALLRENGFDSTDGMETAELKLWFLRKVASGSTTPGLVARALRQLGVELGDLLPEETDGEAPGTEGRPAPSKKEHPVRELPQTPDAPGADQAASPSAVAAAAEVMVYRALERAGNKLRTKMGRKISGVGAYDTYRYVTVQEAELDALLQDSWETCDRFAGQLGVDASQLRTELDGYTRSLLLTQQEHDPLALRARLEKIGA